MRTCLIVLGTLLAASRAAAGDAPTFYKDVLPILQANCQTCHRPGEVAPMSLLTFEQTRPWARAIKTAVATRQMPPWFADPNVGHFANERRLSTRDIDTIDAWVDAGAPAGNANDAPPPLVFENGWNIKPDVDRRDAEAVRAAGTRHHQLQVRAGQSQLHGRPVGERGRDAAGQLEGAAPRQGLGAAAGIEVDGEGGAG